MIDVAQAAQRARPSRRRNWLAWKLATWALLIGTEEYRLFVKGAMRYGMDAAARDVREGRDLPPRWDAR